MKIDHYLGGLDKFYMEFTQISQKGLYQGILLVEKPYKFRVNYDENHPLLIVGNKNFISLYDYELEEVSRISSKDHIFRFLLEKGIEKSESLEMKSCKEEGNNLAVEIQEVKSNAEARLVFDISPFNLKLLEVKDITNPANNIILELEDPVKLNKVKSDLFIMRNPKIGSKIERISTDKLKNILVH